MALPAMPENLDRVGSPSRGLQGAVCSVLCILSVSSPALDEAAQHAVASRAAVAPRPGIIDITRLRQFERYHRDTMACLDRMRGANGLLSDKALVRRTLGNGVQFETLKAETSPTNIALDLLLQAERLRRENAGSAAEATLARSLDTLANQPFHEPSGLFFSWYRTDDIGAASRDVSSVDNIHLALALWTVAEAFPGRDVGKKARALFDRMNFSIFYDESTGLVHGNLKARPDGLTWEREAWKYAFLGSEARSIYTLGYALELFRNHRHVPMAEKATGALDVEVARWAHRDRVHTLLKTWDGGAFQQFLPNLLIDESRYSHQLRAALGAYAEFMVEYGKVKGLGVPAGFSASQFGLEGDEAPKLPLPAYNGQAGTLPLASQQNDGTTRPHEKENWEAAVTPHAVALALTERPELIARELERLEAIRAPALVSETADERLYVPGCAFMDGYVVKPGPHQGKVVPVVLSLDQAMIALSTLEAMRGGRPTLSAERLAENPTTRSRLQKIYELLDQRLRSAAADPTVPTLVMDGRATR